MSKPDLRIYDPLPLDADVKSVTHRSPSSPWSDDGFGMTLPFPTRWPTDPKVPHTTGAPMKAFDYLDSIAASAHARGLGEGEIVKLITRAVHGPVLALIVRLTPNKADDVFLEEMKRLFPLAA